MRLMRLLVLTAALVSLFQVQRAGAAILYAEGVSGDLSNNRLLPTQLVLSTGVNSILATSAGSDREYFTLVLPINLLLTQLILASYDSFDDTSFIGVQAGTTFTVAPTTLNAAGLLGWTHFGPNTVATEGTDILDNIGAGGFGATNFAPPLPSGSYTFWVQQASSSLTSYQLDFVVTSVPEPSTWALLAVGLLAAGALRNKPRTAAR